MQTPVTRYVRRGGVSIAYQVVGRGSVDLVVSPGFASHLDLQWTDPGGVRFLRRLGSFARLILYDKPGTGLSDPIPRLPTLEERVADVEAVMDAAGSERAVVFGISEGGPTALTLAALRPQRVVSLIISGSFAVWPTAAPEDFSEEEVAQARSCLSEMEEVVENWGEGNGLMELFGPSATEHQKRLYAMFARAAASPRMARALLDTYVQIDVRGLLASVQVPTLVLHVAGDRAVPIAAGRRLANGIPGARMVSQPGVDHSFWLSDFQIMADEIEQFVTGTVQRVEPGRVLATVLFTDIVDSTTRAAELGDRAWREVLERHDALVDRVVAEHRGRVVKHIGDGALASFDGPAAAIRCAEALRDRVDEFGIALRSGVHAGECEVIGEDLAGLAVHLGARVSALAAANEILVSSTVKELVVGSEMRFVDRGEHELRGVPGSWRVFALERERSTPIELDGPAAHMHRSDQFAVRLARRLPRTMRAVGRLASRGGPPH